jgi:S-adenosyl methyltransferase
MTGKDAGQDTEGTYPAPGRVPPEIDTTKPHAARMYNFYLGGKDNFAVDREVAQAALKSWPTGPVAARENRAFLGRAVRYLAGSPPRRKGEPPTSKRTCGSQARSSPIRLSATCSTSASRWR